MFKTSKYSTSVNEDLEIRVLDILANSENAMSIQQIQREDIILSHHTSQKITRVLSKLIDMGFVKKGKSRASNHMMYKAVSVMLAQGYTFDDDIFGNPQSPRNEEEFLKNYNVNFELEAEQC